ncbi:hypothetical protein D3C79_1035560 [compost metagenome]
MVPGYYHPCIVSQPAECSKRLRHWNLRAFIYNYYIKHWMKRACAKCFCELAALHNLAADDSHP